MANGDREARKKAVGRLLSLAHNALGDRLKSKKAPAPVEEKPAPAAEDELADDDARRLIELYESKQGSQAEA